MELFKELDNLDGIFSIASKSNTREWHSHDVGQLSVPKNGIIYLKVGQHIYIVPPHMAIFIPKHTPHAVHKTNDLTIIENIYFPEKYFPFLPPKVKTYYLSELARALISRLCQIPKESQKNEKTTRLLNVLFDELNEINPHSTYEIILPHSESLLMIFDYMMHISDELPSLEGCAQLIHCSPRTLQRRLKQELNLSFILWRQQIIFAKALSLLAIHKKTSIVAYKVGFNSESAFIAMFKKLSGQKLPSEYIRLIK